MTPLEPSITIPTTSQGVTGLGQGGWTSARFADAVGHPLRINLRAPIPLDTPLDVVAHDDSWHLVDGETLIMEGTEPIGEFGDTEPVTVEAGRAARERFDKDEWAHQAPRCFSCGLGPNSMRVHPTELTDGSGRFASDWHPPAWTADDAGHVTNTTLWASLDCAAGFYVSGHPLDTDEPDGRGALTVQYEVEVLQPVVADEDHVIVSWHGRWQPSWDGRKRGAGSAVFATDGTLLARSDSLWVIPRR